MQIGKVRKQLFRRTYPDDKEMITAIKSGDIYLHTAKKVGAVPAAAIRKDYEKERAIQTKFSCDWLWTNGFWFKR